MPKRTTRRSNARRSTARRSTRAGRTARRSTARRSGRTARRSGRTARRSARAAGRTARRAAGRTARRAAGRTARRAAGRTARRAAGRTARRTAPKKGRKERVDAVSNILSAAYGIERKGKAPARKKANTQDDVNSFLAGIETSGSYGLKDVFKGDDKGDKVPKGGPIKKRKPTPPRIPRNKKGKVVDEETTGPLDPAGIKENKVEKKSKRKSGKKTSAWIEHVKAFYQEKKKENPDYKYTQALKDAKGTYKKK